MEKNKQDKIGIRNSLLPKLPYSSQVNFSHITSVISSNSCFFLTPWGAISFILPHEAFLGSFHLI